MPYPMTPLPTFRKFKARLTDDFLCSHIQSRSQITDPDGNVFHVWFFKRTIPDVGTVRCVVDIEDDEIVLPGQLKNICTRLHIDPKHFGLHLD